MPNYLKRKIFDVPGLGPTEIRQMSQSEVDNMIARSRLAKEDEAQGRTLDRDLIAAHVTNWPGGAPDSPGDIPHLSFRSIVETILAFSGVGEPGANVAPAVGEEGEQPPGE